MQDTLRNNLTLSFVTFNDVNQSSFLYLPRISSEIANR